MVTSKIVCSIFLHIKHLREPEIAVNFYLSHLVEVKLESFKNNRQDVRQLLDAKSLKCSYLLLAWLTKICIISIQNLTLNISIKGLFQAFFTSNVHADRKEMIYFLTFMRTSFTVELIGQLSLKCIFNNIMTLIYL